jgi:hypothetical protein
MKSPGYGDRLAGTRRCEDYRPCPRQGCQATIVKRTAATARSIEFDALLVAGGTSVTGDIKHVRFCR